MPKQRASTLSALVSLLVERFLPETQQSYVLPNLKAAEWYRRYNDFVPRFLRRRHRSVILHCLDRQSRSNKYHDKDLMDGESIHYTEERQGTVHGRLWQQIPVKGPSVQLLAMTTRAALHQLETLTYNVTEKEKNILTEVNGKLREIYSEFYRRMPNKEGIVLRPRDQ